MLLEEVLRSLSRWLPWSIREGHEWIALRFILPIPSRRVAQRLGPLQAAGGRENTAKEGVYTRLAGAFAELADSTCRPWAARKSSPPPRGLLAQG